MKVSWLSCWLAALRYASITDASAVRRQTQTAASPCAQVSSSAAAQLAANPTAVPEVSAELAYDCLTSVPLNQSDATALMQSIRPYVEWQTDLSYLKNPPTGYLEPAIDVFGEFDTIQANINSGKYQNEHDFQADLFKTFMAVHDGHFRFVPDLIGKALQFRRPVQVVSVSKDGVEVPKVYTREDIEAYNARNGSSMPSPLTRINGQDAVDYLTQFSSLGFLQDPDALYNNVFYEKSFDSQYQDLRYTGCFALAGRCGYFFPGANTTYEFANGTVNTLQNYAEVTGNFTGVTDGPSAYETFCTGPHLGPQPPSNSTLIAPTPPPLPPTDRTPAYGYPVPEVISADDQASGYFLDDPAHPDVAVLSLVSFEPNFPVEFQSVIQTTISKAKAAGKTKIIIDLSSNGGGIILTGYDAFRQFFPNIVQDGFSRFRQHVAFNNVALGVSAYAQNFSLASTDPENFFAYSSPLNYHYDLDQDNKKFPTFESKFQVSEFNGDNFTQLMRWNLSDPTTTTDPIYGIGETITGYGTRTNFTQPFAAEDIVLLYDGYCGSTCVTFSEFMRLQGGVKSVAMGGRPNTDQIQAIGGTKGANNYPFGYIQTLASVALQEEAGNETLTATIMYSDLPLNRSTDTSINVRDNILRANLADGLPAQFVNEPADCRLFYEPNMITDVKALWNKVADAAWGGGKCVAGGFPTRNETVLERTRKSEAARITGTKQPQTSSVNVPIRKQKVLVNKPNTPEVGQKVSWH